jgi:threonine/homoserine/homoserine lactone efflux protein
MTHSYFINGILIGFAMAIPIGPLGIMCIRRTLSNGRIQGLIIGLGAATADMVFSAVAAFGLTFISDILDSQRILIRIIGGSLLFLLGIKTFLTQPRDPKLRIDNTGLIKSYLYSVFITLTNPFTVFAFIAVFATFGLVKGITNFSASALVSGIFIGSFLWFLCLSSAIMLFRKKIDVRGLSWANKIGGVLIIISGLIAIASI